MYSEKQIRTGRIIVIATWIFGALSWFYPLYYMSIGGLGRALFGLLFCVHLVEYAFFRKIYSDAGGSAWGHFTRHMVYGILYKTEVEQGQSATAG